MANSIKGVAAKLFNKTYYRFAKLHRRIRSKEKYRSIDFFIRYLQESRVTPNKKCEFIRDSIITEVCTLDSVYTSFYFPRGCACLVSDISTAQKAIKRGAIVLISPEDYLEYPCLVSQDPLGSFADMCLFFRNLKKEMPITAISGSIGKTTIKNMVGEVYKMKYKTSYTQSNINTRMAVAFAVQHIPHKAEIMIQEIHEGSPNITKYVSRMLRPSVYIISPIDLSHFQFFGSKQKIEEEICSVVNFMPIGSEVIVNVDNFSRFDLLEGKRVITTSSCTSDADYYAKDIKVDNHGLSFSIVDNATHRSFDVVLNNIYAPHNAICALYAFAAGMRAGVSPTAIVKGLGNYCTSGERQNVFRTKDDILIYADCYNAVGKSMRSAIEASSSIPVKGRRIAVLGDMAEIGCESEQMHKEVLEQINESTFDFLFTFGPEFKKAVNKVQCKKSMSIKTTESHADLIKTIKSVIRPGDLILFKGSHSCNLVECIIRLWPKEYRKYIKPAYSEYAIWEKKSLLY